MTRRVWVFGAIAVAILGVLALRRGGLLDLPSVPRDLDASRAGLAKVEMWAARARALESGGGSDPVVAQAAAGLQRLRTGEMAAGLQELRSAVERAPEDLVLGNAYRMAIFKLRRRALTDTSTRMSLAASMPAPLENEPMASLTAIAKAHPCRETQLQLALAWVDEMLLFPALEIKAPASVESVNILSGILANDPWYVPALYGRGLNYLHRPARLVWPEAEKAPRDAASHDLGACIAAGRKVGGGSPRLIATLALALGDAYAKEGEPQRARSWWQIAQNQCHDADVHAAVARRFTWNDAEMLDRLESELQERMLDLDHPMTDLSMVWG